MSLLLYFFFVAFTAACLLLCGGVRQNIKIVEAPTSYGSNYGYQHQATSNTRRLAMRVVPSNFSGPTHLHRLFGRCFTKINNDYKYEFCPFVNVTQHEQSLRWNPYSGVLGVWQEWEMTNNTFVAMTMRHGDACGDVFRSVRVLLHCGNETTIDRIYEPHTCQYELVFMTPLVCHNESLLVYPTLSQELQEEWDYIEGAKISLELTQQGYERQLHSLFVKAGLQLSDKQRQQQPVKEQQQQQGQPGGHGEFVTLQQCQTEYHRLQEEIISLRAQLALHTNISGSVGDSRHDSASSLHTHDDDDDFGVADDSDDD